MIEKIDASIRELADISEQLSYLLECIYEGKDVQDHVKYQVSRLTNISESFNDLLFCEQTDYLVNSRNDFEIPYETIRSRYCN